jgi:hypothetical protein
MLMSDIKKCFGSDASAAGIKFQFMTRIKADVKLINDARASGVDCKDITLSGAEKNSKNGNGA